jgi:hypothetical protein
MSFQGNERENDVGVEDEDEAIADDSGNDGKINKTEVWVWVVVGYRCVRIKKRIFAGPPAGRVASS